MSVLIEALSVVVPVSILEEKFPGGSHTYAAASPNATYCRDDHLTRIGFMAPADVARFIGNLEALGLIFVVEGAARDIAVVDQFTGPTVRCPWFIGGRHPAGYSIGWLRGTPPGTLCAPQHWSPDQSRSMQFVRNEELTARMLPLGKQGGVDVVLDFETGRELHLGSPEPPPSR